MLFFKLNCREINIKIFTKWELELSKIIKLVVSEEREINIKIYVTRNSGLILLYIATQCCHQCLQWQNSDLWVVENLDNYQEHYVDTIGKDRHAGRCLHPHSLLGHLPWVMPTTPTWAPNFHHCCHPFPECHTLVLCPTSSENLSRPVLEKRLISGLAGC